MSNRESQDRGLVVTCTWTCGVCSAVCSDRAVAYGSGDVMIDMTACSRCLICTKVCPAGILEEETFA